MTEGDELITEISEQALNAEAVTTDGVSVKRRSLTELIEADEYLRNRDAAGKRKLPVRIGKIRPGGAA